MKTRNSYSFYAIGIKMANRDNLKTALIIGRWQPWHKGHRELFKAALERAEQVAIGVRATHNTDGSNPFSFEEVKKFIDDDLGEEYNGKYSVVELPNITNVIYGRDVGYKVEKISFDKEIENIGGYDINLTKSSNQEKVNTYNHYQVRFLSKNKKKD